jgi:enamine deaminase RidA (YjgF/YER057c/UK114 family)
VDSYLESARNAAQLTTVTDRGSKEITSAELPRRSALGARRPACLLNQSEL